MEGPNNEDDPPIDLADGGGARSPAGQNAMKAEAKEEEEEEEEDSGVETQKKAANSSGRAPAGSEVSTTVDGGTDCSLGKANSYDAETFIC